MGAFKPLLPFGPHTVIEQVVSTVRRAGIRIIRVVVGWNAESMIPVLDRHGAAWIWNEEFEEGMYASIRAGVRSLPSGVAAFFLLPGDMPLVQSATLTRLMAAWDERPGGILYPCLQGRRGHPPLIAAVYAPEILRDTPPGGLRGLLNRHTEDTRHVDVDDPGILVDLDTPEEYRQSIAGC